MLCEVPLTKEQQTFATAHHSLVYKFLNENRLPEDEFYDVVIFGYLKAVRDYFSDLTAQQFTFSTIANRRMKFCLFDYFRTQERRKRNMEILSIHVGLYPDGAPLEDTIPAHTKNHLMPCGKTSVKPLPPIPAFWYSMVCESNTNTLMRLYPISIQL